MVVLSHAGFLYWCNEQSVKCAAGALFFPPFPERRRYRPRGLPEALRRLPRSDQPRILPKTRFETVVGAFCGRWISV